MTDAKGATRSRENTRARLLDAAAAVFAEVGLDGASVEAICERAGFTRGAFYSNFDSKNELFLALVGAVTRERVQVVTVRIAELEQRGGLEEGSRTALEILEDVLDVDAADRLSVLLMSEIRIHALRDPDLAVAYLAQDDELHGQVTQIIEDIGAARLLTFRIPADQAARLMLAAWDSVATRAVMRGLSDEERRREVSAEIARVAEVVIQPA